MLLLHGSLRVQLLLILLRILPDALDDFRLGVFVGIFAMLHFLLLALFAITDELHCRQVLPNQVHMED